MLAGPFKNIYRHMRRFAREDPRVLSRLAPNVEPYGNGSSCRLVWLPLNLRDRPAFAGTAPPVPRRAFRFAPVGVQPTTGGIVAAADRFENKSFPQQSRCGAVEIRRLLRRHEYVSVIKRRRSAATNATGRHSHVYSPSFEQRNALCFQNESSDAVWCR
jgi:hypothetical protein